MYKDQAPKDKIVLLATEALYARAKSTSTMKGIAKHVSGLAQYFMDTREESKVELTGNDSLILIHDYLESLAERGRTVPATAKRALAVWAEALGIDWPLTHSLVCSAATADSNESPKQAPSMSLSTVRPIGEIAIDKSVTPYKRAFAAGILLVTYASLGFPDVRRIRPFERKEDAARGTLLNCKTRKQHGQHWPWACPLGGVTFSREWDQPLIDMRAAYREINGEEPSFTSMRVGRAWQLVEADAAPYATARRKIALICATLGDTEGGKYTPYSPKNLLPKAANQLKFDQRGLNIIGHWSSTSKMPERCDRSACTNELLLRNTVITRMRDGWAVAPVFRLPETVVDSARIERDKELGYTKVCISDSKCPRGLVVKSHLLDLARHRFDPWRGRYVLGMNCGSQWIFATRVCVPFYYWSNKGRLIYKLPWYPRRGAFLL